MQHIFGSVVKESSGSILGQEDPLEEGMATHSVILAWRIPWTEEPGVLQSMGSQITGHDLVTKQQQCCIAEKQENGSRGAKGVGVARTGPQSWG